MALSTGNVVGNTALRTLDFKYASQPMLALFCAVRKAEAMATNLTAILQCRKQNAKLYEAPSWHHTLNLFLT